jgi:MerR family transcriptional regulator, thiopeptide resistance regulator
MRREWTIHEVAQHSGVTSRTLRHYDDLGLLPPSRTGTTGYRYYDEAALHRLQRILLLRELGLGLSAIADVLDERIAEPEALRAHLGLLEAEAARLARLVHTVRTTLERTTTGQEMDMSEMFDGFDASRYEDEVVDRWGRDAYERSQRTWRELGPDGRREHQAEHDRIGAALAAAAASGQAPDDAGVQELVGRHHDWVSVFATYDAGAYRALTRTYVEDERFRATYEGYGPGTAELLARAADVFAQRALS